MNLTILKIGGNVIDDPAARQQFLTDFAQLPGGKILVHGGGKIATQVADKLGVQTVMIDGRRVTDQPMLDVAHARSLRHERLSPRRIAVLARRAVDRPEHPIRLGPTEHERPAVGHVPSLGAIRVVDGLRLYNDRRSRRCGRRRCLRRCRCSARRHSSR